MHSTAEPDSGQLLAAIARSPESAAWQTLIARHHDLVWAVCWRSCGARGLAEDACQETWLAVRNGARRFRCRLDDGEASVRAWLTRVATCASLDLLRREQRLKERERQWSRDVADNAPPAIWSNDDPRIPALRSAVAELPERHRLPIQLFYFGGLDHRAMAQELRTTPGAARTRLSRAVKALRGSMLHRGGPAVAGLALLALPQPPAWAAAPAASQALTPTITGLIASAHAGAANAALVGGGFPIMTVSSIGLAAVALTTIALTAPIGSTPAAEHGDNAHSSAHSEAGTFNGTVAEIDFHKGAMVVQESDGTRRSYVPRWVGGAPKDGGGLEEGMLSQVRHLIPGSTVRGRWVLEEHPRVIELQVVEAGPSSGHFSGTIVELDRDKGVVVVANDDDRRRFSPHWRGGMPKDGGGLDQAMIERVGAFSEGDRVTVAWEWSERYRVVGIEAASDR